MTAPIQLTISLHDGEKIILLTTCPETRTKFSCMGELMCLPPESPENATPDVELTLPENMPARRHTIWRSSQTEIAISEEWGHVLIAGWQKELRNPVLHRYFLWQMALVCGTMNAILRGVRAVLVHCSVLETERGAVVLFGESGMGKSTASARWRAQGGKCVSDDMALLDFSGGDRIYVRRMPTWSACREGKNEWNYPAGEELPLIGVLALGRSETGQDEIVELSPAQYFAQCYRSMFYWNLSYTEKLPDERKSMLAERIRHFTEIVTAHYPPRALLTSLEGKDLPALIETYLNTLKTLRGA